MFNRFKRAPQTPPEVSDRENLLALCQCVADEAARLVERVEELAEDASEEDINVALAHGLAMIEYAANRIRAHCNDPLTY